MAGITGARYLQTVQEMLLQLQQPKERSIGLHRIQVIVRQGGVACMNNGKIVRANIFPQRIELLAASGSPPMHRGDALRISLLQGIQKKVRLRTLESAFPVGRVACRRLDMQEAFDMALPADAAIGNHPHPEVKQPVG
jgi:hypothetical protein